MPKQTFLNLTPEKQRLIIDCAVDEFADKGYRPASISRIVAAAGIAKGSFYQYFEDKEDLYGYVIEHAIVGRKLKISEQESEKLKELTLTQFLRHLFQVMMREFKANPKLLKISYDFYRHRYDPVRTRISDKYKSIGDNYFHIFIDQEKQRGEIDPNVDNEVLSDMLTGALIRSNDYAQAHGYDAVTEEYIDGLIDKIEYVLTHGIYAGTTR